MCGGHPVTSSSLLLRPYLSPLHLRPHQWARTRSVLCLPSSCLVCAWMLFHRYARKGPASYTPVTLSARMFPRVGAGFVPLSFQVYVKPVLFRRGTQVLRKIPHRRALGLTSSCCFCDRVRFPVSQKALLLRSRCCLQPCPVFTRGQGGLPTVFQGVLRYHGTHACHCSAGAGPGGSEAHRIPNHSLHLNLHLPQLESFLRAAQCALFPAG